MPVLPVRSRIVSRRVCCLETAGWAGPGCDSGCRRVSAGSRPTSADPCRDDDHPIPAASSSSPHQSDSSRVHPDRADCQAPHHGTGVPASSGSRVTSAGTGFVHPGHAVHPSSGHVGGDPHLALCAIARSQSWNRYRHDWCLADGSLSPLRTAGTALAGAVLRRRPDDGTAARWLASGIRRRRSTAPARRGVDPAGKRDAEVPSWPGQGGLWFAPAKVSPASRSPSFRGGRREPVTRRRSASLATERVALGGTR